MSRILAGLALLASLSLSAARAAEPTIKLMRVCDVLRDIAAYSGKPVAIVGRYSYRQNGRFFSEAGCEHELKTGDFVWPSTLRIVFDQKSGPKPPENTQIDGASAYDVLGAIQQHTQLAKFRFGTPDYDRWAVAYGRIEPSKEFESAATAHLTRNALEPAPVSLICVGDAAIVFIVDREQDWRPFAGRAAAAASK